MTVAADPPDRLDDRDARVHALLEEARARALLVLSSSGDDPDRAWFTGRAKIGEALVVVAAGRPARLGFVTPMERDEAAATGLELLTPENLDVARWSRDAPGAGAFLADLASQALRLCGVAPGRVALGGRLPFGTAQEVLAALAEEGWSFVSATELLQRARRRKSAAEVSEVRRVTQVVTGAFRRVAELLAATRVRGGELWLEGERLRVARLKSEVAQLFAAAGLEQPRGNIVAPAEEGGVPHSSGTPERVLRPRESLIVDLFPRGWLFSDCTRTFCVGKPPERIARSQRDVLRALELAHTMARPGASGWALQQRVCELFAEAGHPTPLSAPGTLSGYVHGLGHGVGLELHEQPSFKERTGSDGELAAGDVLTLEPGLYEPGPGGFGVRLEDLVHLTDVGAELLTPIPYELDPRAWASRSPA